MKEWVGEKWATRFCGKFGGQSWAWLVADLGLREFVFGLSNGVYTFVKGRFFNRF